MATQQDISSLTDILGITSHQAEFLLQRHSNNVDLAMNDYLDNGDRALQYHPPQQEQWQESDNLPSFRIDRVDTANSSMRAAPSRPPSRTSYANNEPIDLSDAHAAADPSKVLSLHEQEKLHEQQLQEVLATSRLEYDSAQENGVTGTGQQFGLATGSHYPSNKWALIPSASNHVVREVFEHPRPSKRRRISNEPIFLRGSKETGYLGPLLTIYHSIPLARQALLFPSLKVHAYGYDPNWWNGTSDENDKSISVEHHNVDKDKRNLLCEIQSLMGFLDASNRAYGSVDALADLRAYKAPEADDPVSLLMDSWVRAAMIQAPDEQLTQVFTSSAMKATEPRKALTFSYISPPMRRAFGEIEWSVYDVLDDAIWDDKIGDEINDTGLTHCAEIFTVHLKDNTNTIGGVQIKIPAIWYPDRYLDECHTISWEMRTRRQRLYHEVQRLSHIQQKYQKVVVPQKGKDLNVQITLQAAAIAASIAMKDKALPNGIQEEMQPLLLDRNSVSQSQLQDCQADLQNLLSRISQKLRALEWRINSCRTEFRTAAQILTQAANDPKDPPHHAYYLQGVSTQPHITYVRRQIEEDLINLDDEDDNDRPQWQWWRISFSKDDAAAPAPVQVGPVTEAEARAAQLWSMSAESSLARKIRQATAADAADAVGYSIRKVREYEVLKAAREESKEVLLVYAAETALNIESREMNPALRAFVTRDNQAFEAELAAERESEQMQAREQEPDLEAPPAYEELEGQGEVEDVDADTETETETEVGMEMDMHEGHGVPEMQERSAGGASAMSKIGRHSEDLMSRVEQANDSVHVQTVEDSPSPTAAEGIHLEHPTAPLR